MRIATAVLVLLTSALPVAAQDVKEHQVSGAAGWAGRVLKGEEAWLEQGAMGIGVRQEDYRTKAISPGR